MKLSDDEVKNESVATNDLLKETSEGEKKSLVVNEDKCKRKAEDYFEQNLNNFFPDDEEEAKLFKEKMISFKASEYYNKADRAIAEHEIEEEKPSKKTDSSKEDKTDSGRKFPKLPFKRGLDLIVAGSLAAILGLIGVSVLCVVDCADASYAASTILQSNFVVVLTSTVIAPFFARIMKEKYDIDIEASQFDMIMKDGINSVVKYQKLADQLRDDNGKIPTQHQGKLKDLAMDSMQQTFNLENYKGLISSTASQILDKAIEKAVNENKLEKKPIEKNQIEELIKQSIDAYPAIVKWKDLDPKVKDTIVNGHIRRLLKNIGVEGWGKTALENMFDAEVSNRLVQAAKLDMDNVIPQLGKHGKYLEYTSTAIDVLAKKS